MNVAIKRRGALETVEPRKLPKLWKFTDATDPLSGNEMLVARFGGVDIACSFNTKTDDPLRAIAMILAAAVDLAPELRDEMETVRE